jgi:hypothetical protein
MTAITVPAGPRRRGRADAAKLKLAHLPWSVAEDRRFELLRGCPQHAFQACALGH